MCFVARLDLEGALDHAQGPEAEGCAIGRCERHRIDIVDRVAGLLAEEDRTRHRKDKSTFSA